jgi:hypothetical protein
MSDNKQRSTGGSCPLGFGGGTADIPPTPPIGNVGQPGPEFHPENGLWRPKSNKVGIGPNSYVLGNAFYGVMEFFNYRIARTAALLQPMLGLPIEYKYRHSSWDWWPATLGVLYLRSQEWFNRMNAITEPYNYATNDNDKPGSRIWTPEIQPDGKGVCDDHNLQMGSAMTRYGSNRAPRKVRPDIELIIPSPKDVADLLQARPLDAHGEEIMTPAVILNDMAAAWIQLQGEGFFGNILKDPIHLNPFVIKRRPGSGWKDDVALVDRIRKDPTRVFDDGRPTAINEKAICWTMGMIYGNNAAEQARLRDGFRLRMGDDGLLLLDPSRPGIDLTGISNNYSALRATLHFLFTSEHNAIAEWLYSLHPDWDDDTIFDLARRTNCALMARIHTTEWTEDLLQCMALQLGMHADWYGFAGQRRKMAIMRWSHRHPGLAGMLAPILRHELITGAAGSFWHHHSGPFQTPDQFRLVYRLHQMIRGRYYIYDVEDGHLREQIDLINFVNTHTRGVIDRHGHENLAWSLLSQTCGALTLNNFPGALRHLFPRQSDGNPIDLAELDFFRELERGTGSMNDLRRSLGRRPFRSFLELTGGNEKAAALISQLFQGDIEAVWAGLGIIAEQKPILCALGDTQFDQFILNAPRRVRSAWYLTEGFNYAEMHEGLDWVEHSGGFLGVCRRHLPKLREKIEGQVRGFSPWKDPETFPERQLAESQCDIGKAFRADFRTLVIALVASFAAIGAGLVAKTLVLPLLALLFGGSVVAYFTRMKARRNHEDCEKVCNTDKGGFFMGWLYDADSRIKAASLGGRLGSLAVMGVSAYMAYQAGFAHLGVAALWALTGLSAISTHKWASKFTLSSAVLKVALRNRMRKHRQETDAATVQTKPVDEQEVARLFRLYAPGRHTEALDGYFTEYDFARMAECETAGKGCPLTRWFRKRSMYKANMRILNAHADKVVEEDRKLVPAVSYRTYIRALQGVADIDLKREMEEGNRDPSPVLW